MTSSLTERRVEDLQPLQKYARRDESAVRAPRQTVSGPERLGVRDLCPPGALERSSRRPSARLRARSIRYGCSAGRSRTSIRLLAPVGGLAKPCGRPSRAARRGRSERGGGAAGRRDGRASLDLYRQLRDAAVENVFFSTYGTLSLMAPAAPHEAAPSSPFDAATRRPFTRRSPGSRRAASRKGRRAGRAAGRPARQPPGATLAAKTIRELVGADVGLLDLPADAARAIVQEQADIVDHAPERALQSLPALVRNSRRSARDLLELTRSAGEATSR